MYVHVGCERGSRKLGGPPCPEIGEKLAEWEAKHGERFVELRDQVTTPRGADASNYGKVETAWLDAKVRCVTLSKELPPYFMREERVTRVYAMLPKMQSGFELQ